jgi:putative FmdB family regulatory protein
MPYYVFICHGCHREFTQILRIADMEKGGIRCPHCGSEKVEQQVSAFTAATSKKS